MTKNYKEQNFFLNYTYELASVKLTIIIQC